MDDLKECPICSSTKLESGSILSTGRLYFRPERARFLKLKTANTEVKAHLCLDCGHIALTGDAEKVKGLVERQATTVEPHVPEPLSTGVHGT